MRFVWRKRGESIFSVRDVAAFSVCPLLFLREKIVRKKTRAMEEGKKLHEQAYEDHRARAIELHPKEAVKKSLEGTKLVGREVWVDDGVVGGFVDLMVVENGGIEVIELKSTERSARWPGSAVQAVVYGVLARQYSDDVRVSVATFDGRVFWSRKIGKDEERFVERTIKRLVSSITEGRFDPRPGPYCLSCTFRKTCPVFKDAEEMLLGVIGVKGDGRVHL